MATFLIAIVLLATPAGREPERVAAARAARLTAVQRLFSERGLTYPPEVMLLRGFKTERELEVWAGAAGAPLTLLKTYAICESSGGLGPQRRRGDGQVPEGVYRIGRLNPYSNFHLSMEVSYPNRADRLRGEARDLGGDIYIHGSCVTIGCVPIEDDKIEELYLMVADQRAKHPGRDVVVHLFPRRLDAAGRSALAQAADGDPDLASFWDELAPVFEAFEATRLVPEVRIDSRGHYRLPR